MQVCRLKMKNTDTTGEMFMPLIIMDMYLFSRTGFYLVVMPNKVVQTLHDKNQTYQACKKASNSQAICMNFPQISIDILLNVKFLLYAGKVR